VEFVDASASNHRESKQITSARDPAAVPVRDDCKCFTGCRGDRP